MKKWLILILTALLPLNYALYQTHLKRTKGFSINKIMPYNHPNNPTWNIKYSSEKTNEIKDLLSKPFTYFGSGKTCYVFLSQDKTCVLKLFKQRHMRPFSWFEKIAGFNFIPTQKAKLSQRLKMREKTFTSFKIAHHHLQQETGLIYLHLNPTKHLKKTLYLTDKQGNPFTLDSDSMEFLIQRKAERIFPTLTALIDSGQTEKAKTAIDSIINLIQNRCEKGIDDDDNNCERNIGLIGTEAIEIDIGEFSLNPKINHPEAIKNHIDDATRDLYTYLEKHHPVFYGTIQNTR